MQQYSVNQIRKITGSLTTAQLADVSLLPPILEVPAGLKIWPLMVYYNLNIQNNTNINEFSVRLNNQLNPFLILGITPGASPWAWSGIIGQNGYLQNTNPSSETNPLCNALYFVTNPDAGIVVNQFDYEITYFIL